MCSVLDSEFSASAIAKFPHSSDRWDVMAWEATALGAVDGDHRDYADIAGAMRDLSRSPKSDHHELFDRVTASVALGNTDDHLRNHGFLADRGSWTLSPVFDVNPTPDRWRARATSIMGAEALPDEAEALLAFAGDCSLSLERARGRIERITSALAGWREAARRNQIREREITMMAESIGPRGRRREGSTLNARRRPQRGSSELGFRRFPWMGTHRWAGMHGPGGWPGVSALGGHSRF